MIDEAHITISTYNGVQVSVEVKQNDRWRYLAGGVHYGIDIVYGTATDDDVDETIRTMATSVGEEPARYAASQRDNMWTLFEYRR